MQGEFFKKTLVLSTEGSHHQAKARQSDTTAAARRRTTSQPEARFVGLRVALWRTRGHIKAEGTPASGENEHMLLVVVLVIVGEKGVG